MFDRKSWRKVPSKISSSDGSGKIVKNASAAALMEALLACHL